MPPIDEVVGVLLDHQRAKKAFDTAYGPLYDCECGERFGDSAVHQALKLAEAGLIK